MELADSDCGVCQARPPSLINSGYNVRESKIIRLALSEKNDVLHRPRCVCGCNLRDLFVFFMCDGQISRCSNIEM